MPADLIPIIPATIGDSSVNAVDARTLHSFMKVGRDFSNWIKSRIEEYGFEEGKDFYSFLASEENCSPNLASKGGHNRIDYHLTLDMAKELAMVERNEKGRQARRYFIECERRLLQLTAPRSEPTALVPILTQGERYRSAVLSPETAQALQQLAKALPFDRHYKKKSFVDCQPILQVVVDDILNWRWPCPFGYGFDYPGAFLWICGEHLLWHLENAPHLAPIFYVSPGLNGHKILTDLEYAGLLRRHKKGGLMLDGTRLNTQINLCGLQDPERRWHPSFSR